MNECSELVKTFLTKLHKTGFFHVFGSNVVNKILAFISSVFIVRLVSKADYGIYTSALNILSFFMLISGLGMISGVLQICSENARNPEKSIETYKYGSKIGIYFNIVLGFAIFAFSLIFPLPIKGTNHILVFLSFIPAIEIINEFQKVYFRSELNNKSYSYANTIGSFFVVLLSILGAFFNGVKGLIAGRYLAAIITIIITKKWLKGPISLENSNIKKEEKSALYKISLISMLNGGISDLLYLFDVLLIGILMTDPSAVADYKIAIIIPTALAFIPASICIYIYPYFSMNKDNKIWTRRHYKIIMLLVGFANLLISLLLILLAPFIIKVVFGTQYLSAVSMFRISSMSYFFIGTFRIISGNLLVTQRKLKFNFIISVVMGLINILGNVILIKMIGAPGAALTTLIVSAISGIVLTIYYVKVINNI